MPSVSSLTQMQHWLSTEPAVLLKTILRGRTPSPALMRRHGWWLILMFFVPTVVLDVRAIALRKTAEEEEDGERQRDKRRHKLDRIIGTVGRQVSRLAGITSEDEDVCAQFEALAIPLLRAYSPAETSPAEGADAAEPSSVGIKWELVNDSVKACYRFEKNSARTVAGVIALTHILLHELAEATEKTDGALEERYLDGEELERVQKAAVKCCEFAKGMTAWYALPSRRCTKVGREPIVAALLALRVRLAAARPVLSRVGSRDRRKLLALLWMGRSQAPFLLIAFAFQVVSAAIGTMESMQFSTLTKFFASAEADVNGLQSLIVGLVMSRVLNVVVQRVNDKLTDFGTRAFQHSMSRAVYAKLVAQDMSYFETKFTKPRQAQAVLSSQTFQFMQIITMLLRRTGNLSGILTTVLLLYDQNPSLLGVMAVTTPLTILVTETLEHLTNRWRQAQRETEQYEWTELLAPLESRTAFAAMRYTNREKSFTKKFNLSVSRIEKNQRKIRGISQSLNPVIQMLEQTGTLLGYWHGGKQILSGLFPSADLVVYIQQSNRMIRQIRNLFTTYSRMRRILYENINSPLKLARFMAETPSIGLGGSEFSPDEKQAAEMGAAIVFSNVGFRYPSDRSKKWILKGLNLAIPSGCTVGICGQTGCGKTTILRLLERLYDPSEGSISIGGREITTLDPCWVRRRASFVTSVKDTFVFTGSVRDNIEFGAHDVEGLTEAERLDKVQRAAEAAQLGDTIRTALPNGLDTTIGERSEHDLSDGQTQRLSIARGLINDFRLLLMDEPTSALDGPTERKIMDALRKRVRSSDCTCVMVAHRMSTLRQCDKIVFMADDRSSGESGNAGGPGGAYAKEEGTHDELIALGGKYKDFYEEMIRKEESGTFQAGGDSGEARSLSSSRGRDRSGRSVRRDGKK